MDLSERYPGFRPITSAPGLFSINGFGLTIVGRRDADPETGVYVKTHAVCALFVPLIPVGAYLVADAPEGWYFIGKVPLSRFAKVWNLVLVLAIAAGIGLLAWNSHTSSPEYLAQKRLVNADKLAGGGQPVKAAEEYRELMNGPAAADAKAHFAALLEAPPTNLSDATGVFRVALDLNRQNRCPVPDLYDRAVRHAEAHAARDPRGALGLIDLVASLAPTADDPITRQRGLLEALVAASPKELGPVSRLARLYEAKGELGRCEKLLLPLEADLGASDGAAVLGRMYANKGQFDKAIALLRTYVDARLAGLKDAQTRLTAAETALEQRVINQLRGGTAPGFDYTAFDRSDKAKQQTMIQDYYQAKFRDDPTAREARELLTESSGAVSAALDLGVAYLQRGQAAPPDARKADLEQAEKVFLSVREFAGKSEEYKLSLGQVYHWLGKPAEAKKLFDELLADGGRKAETLLMVSGTLRGVGATTEARALAEEAYEKAVDPTQKKLAARIRSLVYKDLDDQIVWMERSDTDSPGTQASLAWARGNRLARDGQREQAEAQYRASLDAYAKLPDDDAMLNNSALVHFDLAALTGDRAEFARGTDKLDRAVALRPADSILLHNAASAVVRGASAELAAGTVDLAALRRGGGLDLLAFLCTDAAARKALTEKLKSHPGVVKARGYNEKLLVLAPKREDGYAGLSELYRWTRDEAGLKGLADRLDKADLDSDADAAEQRDFLAGKISDTRKEELAKALARSRETLAAVKGTKTATYAVAVSGYVRTALAADLYGTPADADELVRLADDAAAAAPSEGAADTQVYALLFRAHKRLTAASPEYAKLATKTARSLGSVLVVYALAAGGPLTDAAGRDPDVKRLREVVGKRAATDPDGCGSTDWAILAGADAKAADAIAAAERGAAKGCQRRIDRKLSPLGGSAALREYLVARMGGEPHAAAAKHLKDAAARGVPMPVE